MVTWVRCNRSSRLALVAALMAVAGAGCYWSDEEKKKFEFEKQKISEQVKESIAEVKEMLPLLFKTDAASAKELVKDLVKEVKELWRLRREATEAYAKCESDLLRQILESAMAGLNALMGLLKAAKVDPAKLLSMTTALADEYKVEIRGGSLPTPALRSSSGRVYVLSPESRVEARFLGAGDLPPAVYHFSMEGSLGADFELEGGVRLVRVEPLDLTVHLGLGGATVTISVPEGGVRGVLEPSDAVHKGGWKAPLDALFLATFRAGAGADAGAAKRERLLLDLYFSRDLEELSITTLGFK
ncbi:MAG: hypothetical protein HY721_02600, partial [Planctomycetes bacterium]|nr:hypothetical protein [Planctomycetota bacterium]